MTFLVYKCILLGFIKADDVINLLLFVVDKIHTSFVYLTTNIPYIIVYTLTGLFKILYVSFTYLITYLPYIIIYTLTSLFKILYTCFIYFIIYLPYIFCYIFVYYPKTIKDSIYYVKSNKVALIIFIVITSIIMGFLLTFFIDLLFWLIDKDSYSLLATQNTQGGQSSGSNFGQTNSGSSGGGGPNPGAGGPNPGGGGPNPWWGALNPWWGGPNHWGGTPNQWGAPNPGAVAPNQWVNTPNQWVNTPNQWVNTPNQWGGAPNQWGNVPNQWENVPNPGAVVPNQWGGVPNPVAGVPNQWVGVPNPVAGVPSPVGGVPSPVGGVPNPDGNDPVKLQFGKPEDMTDPGARGLLCRLARQERLNEISGRSPYSVYATDIWRSHNAELWPSHKALLSELLKFEHDYRITKDTSYYDNEIRLCVSRFHPDYRTTNIRKLVNPTTKLIEDCIDKFNQFNINLYY